MSKLTNNKEKLINMIKNAKFRYIGIASGVLLAVGISTGVVMNFSEMEDFKNEKVISMETETSTTLGTTVVTTTTAKATTSKKTTVTTSLLTTLTSTAGTKAIETPTIVETTTVTTVKNEPKPAPIKVTEKAVEPTTTETSTVTESTSKATVDETTTTTVAETTSEETTTTTSEPEVQNREYTVYKPSTSYVHRNTCHWVTDECYEIQTTEGLSCRYCTECNPDIEIITAWQPPTPSMVSLQYVTEEERIYLCNTVAYEYGSDWVPLYDKACVVATVMNRVRDGGWTNGLPSTVYNVLTAPYQYNPIYATPYYAYNVTQSCIDAVEYYFAHQGDFPHYTSFWGDGRYNYFR